MCVQVMLKDMADSKRVNGNIKNMPMQAMSPARRPHREAPMATTSATIISALFWPALPVTTSLSAAAKTCLLVPWTFPFAGLAWMHQLGQSACRRAAGGFRRKHQQRLKTATTDVFCKVVDRGMWHA